MPIQSRHVTPSEPRRNTQTALGVRASLALWSPDAIRQFAMEHLDPPSRRSLCWVSRKFYNCLHAITYRESVMRHIPLTGTVSALHQLLAEVGRCDPQQQMQLRIAIAKRLHAFPILMRRRAMETMLASVTAANDKARLLAAMAPAMRLSMMDAGLENCLDSMTWSRLQQWARAQVSKLQGDAALIAGGALLKNSLIGTVQEHAFDDLLEMARSSGTDPGKAAVLRGAIVAFHGTYSDRNKANVAVAAWKRLLQESLSLPVHYRPKLLRGLSANVPAFDVDQVLAQWQELLNMAEALHDTDKYGIYTGMVTLLQRVPQASAKAKFEELWQRCADLKVDSQHDLLERFARVCAHSKYLRGYAVDRIIEASVTRLRPGQRIRPIGILMDQFPECPRDPSLPIIFRIRHENLTVEEWSRLIGDSAASSEHERAFTALFQKTLTLPPSARHWALAGILRNVSQLHFAGGKSWLDKCVMPLIRDIPLPDRAIVLLQLAALGTDAYRPLYSGPRRGELLSPSAWAEVQRQIAELDAAQRADVVHSLCLKAHGVEHPVWPWALEQCQTLPQRLRAPILHALASAKQPQYSSDAGPLKRLLPLIAALPTLYRALPSHAATRMRKHLDFTDSVRTLFPTLRLEWSLPTEDRI
ncbi:hypothetical protein L602_002500000210 [Cupriavidus gilardii J11]|uniref:Uncharacterized protein n=1 Tax=Cupriavidus gilardii J11 TaxID=936133 RepID=A0A562BKH9_9BURK|nr:hypothetical protein L602_002500000210 [Cupriavidus gilardii J11]